MNQFDVYGFEHFERVDLPDWVRRRGFPCESLTKQNSLFITDLDVVEDPSRTFFVHLNDLTTNPTIGNPTGVWTFGHLVQNIVNTTQTGVTTKEFLKKWLDLWMTGQTVNGEWVAPREEAFRHIILPWISKAKTLSACTASTITKYNWKCFWDDCTEANLLKFAPFKLTAIVNRLDLRGNNAYKATIHDGGETRFIFTLVNQGFVENHNDPRVDNAGMPPHSFDPPTRLDGMGPVGISEDPGLFADWFGMNLIFEYNNTFTTRCEMKEFAEKWLHLTAYEDFGDAGFLEELEAITETVIESGISTTNCNHSALTTIRTNERILELFDNSGQTINEIHENWRVMDWEMRQFELETNCTSSNAGYLKMTPVTNTPALDRNFATFDPTSTITIGTNGSNFSAMWNWINPRIASIILERHTIPMTYLAAVSRQTAEHVHYYQIPWPSSNIPANFRALRNKYSLNTCQGCHGGETKTFFTHVRPLGYGQSANYWRSAVNDGPDVTEAYADLSSHFELHHDNTWQTHNTGGSVDNYPKPENERYFDNVSAFITGRSYSGEVGNGTYQDDRVDDVTDNALDNTLDGQFWVNDPSNDQYGNSPYPSNSSVKTPYNELQRRKDDLCSLLNSDCNNNRSVVISIADGVSLVPFPIGGH